MNDAWREGDGGELRVYGPVDSEEVVATIAPTSNRLLLFWSDARVPHEVLQFVVSSRLVRRRARTAVVVVSCRLVRQSVLQL